MGLITIIAPFTGDAEDRTVRVERSGHETVVLTPDAP
jgi:hypothetical protein